jgi:hypothetical protein
LQKIDTMEAANSFLPSFTEDYNRRFAKPARHPTNAHRALLLSKKELRIILSPCYERKVTKNLEVHYQNKIYQLNMKTPSYTLRQSTVSVYDYNGTVTIVYKGKTLPYTIFDKNNPVAEVVTSKQLDQVVDNHLQTTKALPLKVTKPAHNHPWKSSYKPENLSRGT